MKILLIEPNPADARWLSIVLEESDYDCEVLTFNSSVQALAILRPQVDLCADLVIVNYNLPFIEVDEAIKRLSAIPCLANVPFAVTISQSFERARVTATDLILQKPLTEEQLLPILAKAVSAQK